MRRIALSQVHLDLAGGVIETSGNLQPEKQDNKSLFVSLFTLDRASLERGDRRRSGVVSERHRGLYLAELILTIIEQLSFSLLNGQMHALWKHLGPAVCAKLFSVARNSTSLALSRALQYATTRVSSSRHQHGLPPQSLASGLVSESPSPQSTSCTASSLQVQVLYASGLSVAGKAGNIQLDVELRCKGGRQAAGAEHLASASDMRLGKLLSIQQTSVQLWSKSPTWNETFLLGPIPDTTYEVRVACYHCPCGLVSMRQLIGEVMFSVSDILEMLAEGDVAIGWFPLRGAPANGKVKLRLETIPSLDIEVV